MCKIQFHILDGFFMQIEWNEKRRNSISCLSPVVSNAGIAPSFYLESCILSSIPFMKPARRASW